MGNVCANWVYEEQVICPTLGSSKKEMLGFIIYSFQCCYCERANLVLIVNGHVKIGPLKDSFRLVAYG